MIHEKNLNGMGWVHLSSLYIREKKKGKEMHLEKQTGKTNFVPWDFFPDIFDGPG